MTAVRAARADLSLKDFLLRGRVLALYRGFVRATRPLPSQDARRETVEYYRDEFEKMRHVTDHGQLESLLTHGRIHLRNAEGNFLFTGDLDPGTPSVFRGTRPSKTGV
ncbi:hypothetical protein MSPP1_002680 [Malassezia sp. CBS 17886]|nr:hypothetical protein MSPP1_002680 [Malassezia sp. CBS 17886]